MEHREPPRIAPGDRRIDGVRRRDPDAIPAAPFRPRGQPASDRLRPRRLVVARRAWLRSPACALSRHSAPDKSVRLAGTSAALSDCRSSRSSWFTQPPTLVSRGAPSVSRTGAPRFGRVRIMSRFLNFAPDDLAAGFKKYAWVERGGQGRVRPRANSRRTPVSPAGCAGCSFARTAAHRRRRRDHPADGRRRRGRSRPIVHPRSPVTAVWLLRGDSVPARPGNRNRARRRRAGRRADLGRGQAGGFPFEQPQADDARRSPALHVVEINVTDSNAGSIRLSTPRGRRSGGDERPELKGPASPTAEEKWAILRRWEEHAPARFLGRGDYWEFTQKGSQACLCSRPKLRHRPKRRRNEPVGLPEPRHSTCKVGIIAADRVPLVIEGLERRAVDARSNW